jgi:hypothetical protein
MTTNAICVIAFILSDIDMNRKAKTISEVVMVRLDNQIRMLKEETEAITAVIKEKITKIADTIKAQVATIVVNMTEEIKTATWGMSKTSTKLAETTTEHRDALTQPVVQNQATTPPTNSFNPKLRAREGMKTKQVLIELDLTANPMSLKDDTVATLK